MHTSERPVTGGLRLAGRGRPQPSAALLLPLCPQKTLRRIYRLNPGFLKD